MTPPSSMRCVSWRPYRRGTLRGFLDIEVEVGNGHRLEILECPVHTGPNGPWVALPGRPQLDRDGNVRRKANGKPEYVSVLRWGDAKTRDRFSSAVIKLLLARHPDALDPAEAWRHERAAPRPTSTPPANPRASGQPELSKASVSGAAL